MISKKYLKKPLKPIQLWVAMKKGSFAEKFWIIIIPLFDAVTQNPQTKIMNSNKIIESKNFKT
jgi:hypothetical protein